MDSSSSKYIYFTLDDDIESLVCKVGHCPRCDAPLSIDLRHKENKKYCSSCGYEDDNKRSLEFVTKSAVLEGRVR